ncbi:hypothetical protein [Paenibacillus sp. NPDC058071]|uniref:hypothetical protein n=1 Tax=Paenibacillus sp. NPDC058071 TaxID=3346326 RepID=UPI0036DD3F59
MEKKLPIVEPIIKCYQSVAYPLSIILAHDEAWPWLYSNFIQLYSPNGFEIMMHNYEDTNFKDYPWLVVNDFESLVEYGEEELVQSLIQAIDRDQYVYLFVDEFYIPRTGSYGIRTHVHDLLINGYDLEAQKFYVSGYVKNSQYTFYTVSFEELASSALNGDSMPHKEIKLLKYSKYKLPNYTYLAYKFDMENVVEQLADYLSNQDTSVRTRMLQSPNHFFSGIQVYKVLYSQIKNASSTGRLELHPFLTMYEHKLLMNRRVEYFIKQKGLHLDAFLTATGTLAEKCLSARNLALKFLFTGDHSILVRLTNHIKELEALEYQVFTDLHAELNTVKPRKLLSKAELFFAESSTKLDHLFELSTDQDNYPDIYDRMASLYPETIASFYEIDRDKANKLMYIFLKSMEERNWPAHHTDWFVSRCRELLNHIEDSVLREMVGDSLKAVSRSRISASRRRMTSSEPQCLP